MFENENDFKNLVDQLNIDTEPNDNHRENLCRQTLSAFSRSRQHRISWQTITKLAAAAAVIIVAIGLFLIQRGPNDRVEPPKVPKVSKSPSGLTTVISLKMAYRQGGLQAVEKQCDRAVRILGARLDGISAGQLIRGFNIEKQEREKL